MQGDSIPDRDDTNNQTTHLFQPFFTGENGPWFSLVERVVWDDFLRVFADSALPFVIDAERRSSEVKPRCQRAKRRNLTFSHHQNSSITLQYHMAFSVMRKVPRMPFPAPIRPNFCVWQHRQNSRLS